MKQTFQPTFRLWGLDNFGDLSKFTLNYLVDFSIKKKKKKQKKIVNLQSRTNKWMPCQICIEKLIYSSTHNYISIKPKILNTYTRFRPEKQLLHRLNPFQLLLSSEHRSSTRRRRRRTRRFWSWRRRTGPKVCSFMICYFPKLWFSWFWWVWDNFLDINLFILVWVIYLFGMVFFFFFWFFHGFWLDF